MTAPRPRALATLVIGLMLTVLPARGDDAGTPDTGVFDQVCQLVQQHFVDRKLNGVPWQALRQRFRPRIERAETQQQIHAIIQEMLGALEASHLTLIEGDVFRDHILSELKNTPVMRFGLDLEQRPEGLFVAGLGDGGAAVVAGLRRGDRIVSIDGIEPLSSKALRPAGSDPGLPGAPAFHLEASAPLTLMLERRPEAKDDKGVFTITLRPKLWNLVAATAASVRVIDKRGMKLGYVHLWHLAHVRVVETLSRAMVSSFQDCQGLVLDLRGRGGTPDNVSETLALFDRYAPHGPRWTRPVVVIIDGSTRSAKEVLAFHLKLRGMRLVGERSQGAVLGARFFELRDGAYLMLPTVDVRALTRGVNLERCGVEPDVPVEDSLPWADGKDPLYERAVEELFWQVRAKLRRHYTRGWY